MIRKFFGMMIFIATILTASFGEHIFSRADIDHWATNIRQNGPGHAHVALQKTDDFIANLATQAGSGYQITCTLANPTGLLKA